jgi:hypothetical protein
MICPNCAAGADLTAQPAALLEATRTLAIEEHNTCTGCDCQHRVPDLDELAKRREAMRAAGLTGLRGVVAALTDPNGTP